MEAFHRGMDQRGRGAQAVLVEGVPRGKGVQAVQDDIGSLEYLGDVVDGHLDLASHDLDPRIETTELPGC
jgi:hypothetical protein